MPDSGASFTYVAPPPAPYPAPYTCGDIEDSTTCSTGPLLPDDDYGHGTLVAGVLAATGDNNVGIAGVAWGITPISIKVSDCNGNLQVCSSARAIDWARTRSIPILNMSYETEFDNAQLSAIRNAFHSGEFLVASAGNYNGFVANHYPSSHAKMVCGVAAYFLNGRRWVDSLVSHATADSKGSTYGPWVDLAAPGGTLIASTDAAFRQLTNQYKDLSSCGVNFGGTSAAAPVVSGIAALIHGAYTAHGASGTEPLLGEDLYQAMILTARHPDGGAFDDSVGFGHVRADTALKLLASPREIYHKRITRPVIVDTFTSTRTLRNIPGLPSADSTYAVKTYVMRTKSGFSPHFTSTPMVWTRSSGSVGAKDTSVYDYNNEVNYGKIVAVTTDSVTILTNIFKIIGVSSTYEWFPSITLNAAIALTAVGVPASSPSIRNPRTKALPSAFALHQNRPNPFSQATQIAFDLPSSAAVRLEVFDAQGRLVRLLADRIFPAGSHRIEWDHKADGGRQLGAGVYLFQLKAGAFKQQKKMLLLDK